MCFASEQDGSWGQTAIRDVNHCLNCGAGGSVIAIPPFAVKSIREQASWVGRRYYPNAEDTEATEERHDLLVFVESFYGRSAEPATTIAGHWNVTQKTPTGSSISTLIKADSEADAIEKSRYRLRYFAPERFLFPKGDHNE